MANDHNLIPFTGADDPRRGVGKKGMEHSKTRMKRLLGVVLKGKLPMPPDSEGNPQEGKQEQEFTVLELMDAALIKKAMAGDTSAYKEVLDRFEGKAREEVKQTVETIMKTLVITPASKAKKDGSK